MIKKISLILALSFMHSSSLFAQAKLANELVIPKVNANAKQSLDQIAVVVNQDIITRNEWRNRVYTVEHRLMLQGASIPERSVLQKQVLEQLIMEKIQLQLAKQNNVRIDEAQLNQAVARVAEQNGMTLAQFRAELESERLTFERFREDLRNEMILSRLREREVDAKVSVSDSEIRQYINDVESNAQLTEFELAEILFKIPEQSTPEAIQKIQTRAGQVLAQLKQGADFAQIAKQVSEADSKEQGGDLGWRSASRLPQLFVEAVAELPNKSITPILRSANGFHILQLIDRRKVGMSATNQVTVPQIHVRQIMLKVGSGLSSAAAQKKLIDIKKQLINGASFAELARLYSKDESAAKGGDLGWVYPGDTPRAFEQVIAAMQPGDISEPFESPAGWHLVQVTERKTDKVSEERKRLLAAQVIKQRKVAEAAQIWLTEIRDSAYVEYRIEQ